MTEKSATDRTTADIYGHPSQHLLAPLGKLIDAADQDDLRALARIMSATPLVTTPGGQTRINIAQLSIFHKPTPITQAHIDGFGQRRIAPYEDFEIPEGRPRVTPVNPEDIPGPLEQMTAHPYNGFDEFFDAYFDVDDD